MLPLMNALVTAICLLGERRDKGLHKCVKFHRTNMMIDAWSGSHYVERLAHEQMHNAWAHMITLRRFTRGLLKLINHLEFSNHVVANDMVAREGTILLPLRC